MSKHKSEDYKITAVKYYLENNTNYTKTCDIVKCSERSLIRWIERYEELEEIKRLNRKPVSYKITKEQVKYAIQELKENEQITMEELYKIVKKKYKDFDITPQHLGQIIRDNNITRKRTRHEHYPKERYGKPTDIKKELKTFYKEISKYSLDKIICLDETSIQPALLPIFSKCSLGKRCVVKTDDTYKNNKLYNLLFFKSSNKITL